jgi:hypothetical protein
VKQGPFAIRPSKLQALASKRERSKQWQLDPQKNNGVILQRSMLQDFNKNQQALNGKTLFVFAQSFFDFAQHFCVRIPQELSTREYSA